MPDDVLVYEIRHRPVASRRPILRNKEEVPGQGCWALSQDPTGAVNAVWENNPAALQQQQQPWP